jgi:hypothetical protein
MERGCAGEVQRVEAAGFAASVEELSGLLAQLAARRAELEAAHSGQPPQSKPATAGLSL